ncbi:PIG-L deacetylase family protein [Saccharopolyspora spinosa]|uniref:LmbE family N-acetylglucosaminyl deacetylase n=1 Tax=Saccharopolyspora spinosa TaxID=60894 RepID=A0A2N3Y6S0_SACSN|nr:PIG-L family deacetylase [Saccharopolyspora spinosa]PKW18634.1 LmbE family N-acetylglucosaminyl deacetylase [Saccharopolyspora spinosa]
MNTVLVVVAHPDDAEIGMAMRMRWYALNGARVRVHCLTTGAPAGDGTPVRRDECLAAGALLGVDQYSFSSIPDTQFLEHRGRIHSEVVAVVRETCPDVVYTHHPNDQHRDHNVTAEEVTNVALREAPNLSYFRSPYSLDFEPTMLFIGTPELLDAKIRALNCFTSQHQLDMGLFHQLATVTHRQHIHHRVVKRFPPDSNCAESFRIARRLELATQTDNDRHHAHPQ